MTVELKSRHVVVCVDDERAVLEALRRALRNEPCEVETWQDPAKALQRVGEGGVSLLIADQRMPSMQGTELLRAARQRDPCTTRVMLTGYADLEAVAAAVNEGGIRTYLQKPWDDEQLRAVVRRLLYERELEMDEQRRSIEMETRNRELSKQNRGFDSFLSNQMRLLRAAQDVLERLPVPVAVVGQHQQFIALHNAAFLHLVAGRVSAVRTTPIDDLLPLNVCERIRVLFERDEKAVLWDERIGGRQVNVHLIAMRDRAVLVYVEL